MNSIKLNGGGQIDAQRTTSRLETGQVTEDAANAQKTGAAPPKTADSINVSERATEIHELTAKAEQLPDVREERIEKLRAQVQSGDYRPSAEEIADALLRDAQGTINS